MSRLIALYRSIRAWLFDVEEYEQKWVGVQTQQGLVYAWLLTRKVER
jgi:hypothetical protein